MNLSKPHRNSNKSYQDYMDELLAEVFYGEETEEEEWYDQVIRQYNDYSYEFWRYDEHTFDSNYYDCCDDFNCEYCQGGICLIDDYGEKIFNYILNENCCSVGKYQMDYDEAKHIMTLYEKYKNNPKQVEFILKLQGEE